MDKDNESSPLNRLYGAAKSRRKPDVPVRNIPIPKIRVDDEREPESGEALSKLYRQYKQRRSSVSNSVADEVVNKGTYSAFTRILIPMLLGALLGLSLHVVPDGLQPLKDFLVDQVFDNIGLIFVALFKMMVVPIVFVSLVSSVTSFTSLRALGRIGAKSASLYLISTLVAVSTGLFVASWLNPGQGFQITVQPSYELAELPSSDTMLSTMTPTNVVKAMAEGHVIGVIIFALLFAGALRYSGEDGRHVQNFFHDLNTVIQNMLNLIMKLAPLGTFALMLVVFANQGVTLIKPLLGYMLVVILTLLIHYSVFYSLLLRFVGSLNPLDFLKKMPVVNLFAFSTASSNATIPVNMKNAKDSMGVSESMSSLTIPLGATMNMDGTAIMQGVAAVFIANVYGIDLGPHEYLTIVLATVIASVGTAGVPGVGLAMLAIVLQQAGLPLEGIGLIIGVDRLLDMLRTAVNVTGDAAVTCVVANSEKQMDVSVFKNPSAGIRSV